jgi:peptidoglycan-associated lipoprotein
MKKHILALTLSMIFATTAIAAERTDQEIENEVIGASTGVVIGTIVAGPVGGIVAALFGIIVADGVNDKNEIDNITAKLDRRDSQLVALTNEFDNLKQQNQIQLVSMDTQIERVTQETESNVQFRTGSYQIEDHFKPQLDLMAEGLLKNTELTVSLSGFADRRGDDTYNQALSEQRVLSVKKYLFDKGVKKEQIISKSFGENHPVVANQTFESDFFDRRVVMRLTQGNEQMTASNL